MSSGWFSCVASAWCSSALFLAATVAACSPVMDLDAVVQGELPTSAAGCGVAVEWVPDRVEIFIDMKTVSALHLSADGGWSGHGLDHELFCGGMIPFKGIRVNAQGAPVHDVAAKGYAMAHKSNKVSGAPVALVSLSVPPVMNWTDLLSGAVTIDPRTSTYGLRRNAPANRLCLHWLAGDCGQQALEQGYSILELEKMVKMHE